MDADSAVETWQVALLSQRHFNCFCLPGAVARLSYHGLPLLFESNGVCRVSGALPSEYKVTLGAGRGMDAWGLPVDFKAPLYSVVPDFLEDEVAKWVAESGAGAVGLSVAQRAALVERFFHRNFTYRLGVRLEGAQDPLLTFMRKREGACGLFASAATLMFRHCAVPARLVGGYLCSDRNVWLQRWVVRGRDAHVWVEIWDESTDRWLLVDPTPPDGCPTALQRSGRFRWTLDWVLAKWHVTVTYLKNANFLEVIADLGEALFYFLWDVFWSLPGAAALVSLLLVLWLRRRARLRNISVEQRLRMEMASLMRKVARAHVPAHLRRAPAEPWSDWLARVTPTLKPHVATELGNLLEEYQTLRYSARLDQTEARHWLTRATVQRGTQPPDA